MLLLLMRARANTQCAKVEKKCKINFKLHKVYKIKIHFEFFLEYRTKYWVLAGSVGRNHAPHIILIGTRGLEVNQPNYTLNSWVLLLNMYIGPNENHSIRAFSIGSKLPIFSM